jgi:hypothetical protein
VKSLPTFLSFAFCGSRKVGREDWGWGGLSVAAHNVRRLESFGTFEQLELHNFAFVQRAISIFLDDGEMDEHVFACGALDETISLGSVKPLYCTLLFIHENSFRLRIKSLPLMVPRLVIPDSIEVSSRSRRSSSLTGAKRKADFAATGGR